MVTLTCWIPADVYDMAVKLAAAEGKTLEQWLHDVLMSSVDDTFMKQD